MTEIQLPEPGLFGRKATRRAVVRGLLRTAFLALMAFFVLSLLAQLLGNALMNALGRADDLTRVGFAGYQVGHPGLDLHHRGFRVGAWSVSGGLSATTQDGVLIDVPMKVNLFGTLSRPPTQLDPLDRARLGPGLSAAAASAFLRGLPSGVRVDALVQLARPLHTADVPAAVGSDVRVANLFYTPVFGAGADFVARPVTWSESYSFYEFPGPTDHSFRAWAQSLRASDDENLRTLDLPTSGELQRLAQEDLVRAVWVRDMTPARLKALLANPAVRSFTPSAVRFALPGQIRIG